MIVVGAPDCYQHTRRVCCACVCLPDPDQVTRYHWPTAGLILVAILLCPLSATQDAIFCAELLAGQPLELAVRYWPTDRILIHTP